MPANRNRADIWKNLTRDEKGRWIKKPSANASKDSKKSLEPASCPKCANETSIQKTIDAIETEFNANCPRCGGSMRNRPIRCGPERIVNVRQCGICNFYIPVK